MNQIKIILLHADRFRKCWSECPLRLESWAPIRLQAAQQSQRRVKWEPFWAAQDRMQWHSIERHQQLRKLRSSGQIRWTDLMTLKDELWHIIITWVHHKIISNQCALPGPLSASTRPALVTRSASVVRPLATIVSTTGCWNTPPEYDYVQNVWRIAFQQDFLTKPGDAGRPANAEAKRKQVRIILFILLIVIVFSAAMFG